MGDFSESIPCPVRGENGAFCIRDSLSGINMRAVSFHNSHVGESLLVGKDMAERSGRRFLWIRGEPVFAPGSPGV